MKQIRPGLPERVGLACAIALFGWPVTSVMALHFDRSDYVTAMQPCPESAANTATNNGIPACSPPFPRSSCESNPQSALRFRSGGRGDFIVRPTGRKLTHGHSDRLDLDVTLRFSGLEACSGAAPPGQLTTSMIMRMTLQDPGCKGGKCTVPDLEIPFELFCAGRSCRDRLRAESVLGTIGGSPGGVRLPRIPYQFPWTAEMIELSLRDLAGNAISSYGLRLGSKTRPGFPRTAKSWEARLVRAYQPCDLAAADTTTTDGVPACSAPRPVSDCAVDSQAVGALASSKGKFKVTASKAGIIHLTGRLKGLRTCSGMDYNGVLRAALVMRITLEDAACTGGFCTTVDTAFEVPVQVENGAAFLRSVRIDGVPLGKRTLVNAEILRAEVRDPAGRAVLAGQGFFVRCDPREDGTGMFCYGN